jgi:hypothetical protein
MLTSRDPSSADLIQATIKVLEKEVRALQKQAHWTAREIEARQHRLSALKATESKSKPTHGSETRPPILPHLNRSRAGRPKAGDTPRYKIIENAARDLIINAGRPLHRGEILKLMTEAGHILEVGNPSHFIGKVLLKSPNYVHCRGGYWPSDVELPIEARSEGNRIGKPKSRL